MSVTKNKKNKQQQGQQIFLLNLYNKRVHSNEIIKYGERKKKEGKRTGAVRLLCVPFANHANP